MEERKSSGAMGGTGTNTLTDDTPSAGASAGAATAVVDSRSGAGQVRSAIEDRISIAALTAKGLSVDWAWTSDAAAVYDNDGPHALLFLTHWADLDDGPTTGPHPYEAFPAWVKNFNFAK